MINTRSDFRTVERGDVEFETNARSQTSDRFVDRSRLKTRQTEEYVPSATPGKPGKYVARTLTASIEDNSRQECDSMGHVSAFRDDSVPANSGNSGCCPSPFYDDSGPLTKRRGDCA
jgi:hypothetical protein